MNKFLLNTYSRIFNLTGISDSLWCDFENVKYLCHVLGGCFDGLSLTGGSYLEKVLKRVQLISDLGDTLETE